MYEELKRLLKHTTIYGTGTILGKIVGFCMIPVYTRYLTPLDYGTIELLDLSVTLLGCILITWLNASIIRQYYDYEEQTEKNQVISTTLVFAVVLGLSVFLAGFSYARQLSEVILKSPVYSKYVILELGIFITSCLNTVALSYLRATQKSSFVLKMEGSQLFSALCLNIYFVVIRQIGVIGVLYSSLISASVVSIVVSVMMLREVGISFSFAKLRALISFGYPLVFPSLAAFGINFSDRFFLQHYTNVASVGVYSLGYKFGFMLSYLLIQPFDTIWGARMYDIAREPDSGRMFARILSYYCLVLTVAALGLSLVIREVVTIVAAPAFLDAYKIVPIVALAYIFQGMQRYLVTGMFLNKKSAMIGLVGLLSAGLSLVANWALVPRYGSMGAAWATVLSFFGMAALTYLFSQKAHYIPYEVGRTAILLAVAVLFYAASMRVPHLALIPAASVKLLIMCAFFLSLFAVRWFDEGDIQQAKRVFFFAAGRIRMASSAAAAKR